MPCPNEWVLDPKPVESPQNTVLLICRNTKKEWPTITNNGRYWLDPDADSLARRSEFNVHDNKDYSKIVWANITEIEESGVSPQAIAYPTKIRECGVDEKQSIRFDRRSSFYVDFDAEIADELFKPPK